MLFIATFKAAFFSASQGWAVGVGTLWSLLEGSCGLGSSMLLFTPAQWGQLLQSPLGVGDTPVPTPIP